MSFQLVLYKSCLKEIIVSKLKILLKIKELLFSILGLVDRIIKQMGKWSETSLLKIALSKFLSAKELVRIWSIAVVNSFSCDSGRFIYGRYHAISVNDIKKIMHFFIWFMIK